MAILVKNLKKKVLENAKESDQIIIITGYFSPDMIDEIAKMGVPFVYYYGMYGIDKIAKPGDGSVRIIDLIQKAFADAGYAVLPDLSNAIIDMTEYGVPQNRKRIIILGVSKEHYGDKAEAMVEKFYSSYLPEYKIEKKATVRDAIGDLPKLRPLDEPISYLGRKLSHSVSDPLINGHISRFHNNDKYNVSGGTRNEYRIYCNGALEGKQLLFQPDDILIFRAKKTSSLPKDILGSNDVPEAAVEEANVFFLYRCCDKNSELYRMCKKLVDESNIRGNGHAIYQGIITEVENKINQLCVKNFNEMDTVIEDTVTAKAQSGDIDEMASLFNSVSFRDFVMTGYKQKCAITGNVIQYKLYMSF